ncbi:MAG: Asp-tRNA(Asn)/Glu-tRNA(Gln) amidotransferase subunit GatC [Gemmatimonadota bacterium]
MSVKREEVLRIAKLARLRLDEDELERMTGDLNSILEHVDALGSLEGDGEIAGTAFEEGPSTRDEEASDGERGLDPSVVAPAWRDGFYLVPPPPGVHAEGDGS